MAALDCLRRARLSVEANGKNVCWRPVEHICPARSGQWKAVWHVASIV